MRLLFVFGWAGISKLKEKENLTQRGRGRRGEYGEESLYSWKYGRLELLIFFEPFEGVGEGFDRVGNGGGDIGGGDGVIHAGFDVSRYILISLALTNQGIGFLGSIENVVESLATYLRGRANIVIGAGHAGLGSGRSGSFAGGEKDVRVVDAGLGKFGAVEVLAPEDDEFGRLVVEAHAFEFFRGVEIPHFLLIGSEADLDGLAVGVGDGEFEFAILGGSDESAGGKEESDKKEFPKHRRPPVRMARDEGSIHDWRRGGRDEAGDVHKGKRSGVEC